MRSVWRYIHTARNSYAALYAACETYGFTLEQVDVPEGDVVCYSLNSIEFPRYKDEIAAADQITIVGGPHASAAWEEVARVADYVVIGEGERTLPRLLSALEIGTSGASLPGVATKTGGRNKIDHSIRLDGFPCFTRIKGYIEISRGCPFHCGYCQTPHLHGTKMRHRSREEIVKAASHYRDARFVTPNAFAYGSIDGKTPDVEKLERLLASMPNNNIYFGTFPCEVRPEFVTQETTDLVVQYCTNTKLHFGAQSGSNTILTKIGRDHTLEDVYAALDICRIAGLEPIVDVIFGFPFETDEDEEATLALIREVVRSGKVHVHSLMPLPGTTLSNVVPREIIPAVDRVLGKLALNGCITGTWHNKFD
ncbi:MAG: TIGR04013 family B12-binding domain/radical SAM domain-containing protein [Methanocalculaceae archaeon]|jgi:B12-binding domain/radical SAM domain protein|nr:TIGR04013 family B12-binding domain/radical SAM domain-containing protein [Methanocalculaceae archaeon]